MTQADLSHVYRSEAKTVPNLLVAPISPTAPPPIQDIYEDYPQGYYADGAYTAMPPPSSDTGQRRTRDESEASDVDPQEAYYTALHTRFSTLSSHLQHPPPLPANRVLNTPAGFNTGKEWRNKILRTQPKMGILALLQQETVIRGLEVLEDLLTAGNLRKEGGRNIGAWAWGLLARCRELGTMGSEEVGVVRRVGKRGVQLLRRMRAGEVVEVEDVRDRGEGVDDSEGEDDDVDVRLAHMKPDEVEDVRDRGEGDDDSEGEEDETNIPVAQTKPDEVVDEEEDDAISNAPIPPITSLPENSSHLRSPPAEGNVDSALAEARARMLASLNSTDEKQEVIHDTEDQQQQQQQDSVTKGESGREGAVDEEGIHATLDMIVTIVGEVYGQRDLLDGRFLWDEM